MVKALGNITSHFNVLNLIASHGHFVGIENQNIGGHKHRIRKQTHGNREIGVLPRFLVGLHGRFVGVCSIHEALRGVAGKNPAQLGNLGNIRLAVKMCLRGIQTQCQPCCGYFSARLRYLFWIVTLNQCVIISQKQIGIGLVLLRSCDSGANSTDVVP